MIKYFVFIWIIVAGANLWSGTFYVCISGNNRNIGSLNNPWRDIQYAVNSVSPGDTILVREGEYNSPIFITVSGERGNMITLKNYPGELPHLNGWVDGELTDAAGIQSRSWEPREFLSHYRIEGLYISGFRWGGISLNWHTGKDATAGAVSETAAKNIEIRHNVVDECGQNGISVFFTEDVIIENNVVSRTGWDTLSTSWSSGINLYAAGGTNIIRNNISFHHVDVSEHHTDGNGFILDLSYDVPDLTRIYNNVAFRNGGSGIVITRSGNYTVVNNTCFENGHNIGYGGGDFAFSGAESFSGDNVFVNNVGFNGLRTALTQWQGDIFSSPNITVSNNLLYPGIYGGDRGVDPMIPEAEDANFYPAYNSPLSANGSAIYAPPYDIGFDHRALKMITGERRYPWYTHKPDIEFIRDMGGLKKCFYPQSRGGNPSVGAFELKKTEVSPGEKMEKNSSSKLFFNPATSVLSYELGSIDAARVEIFSVSGKRVGAQPLFSKTGVIKLNIGSGAYILRLSSLSQTYSQMIALVK
ncbi:hypothetical protein CHISP_2292 [Chitinispirillum alkaliphilum]|nr:hypothetical protein CHISP_2292 [Chitinispirillum alkaliphilum]